MGAPGKEGDRGWQRGTKREKGEEQTGAAGSSPEQPGAAKLQLVTLRLRLISKRIVLNN